MVYTEQIELLQELVIAIRNLRVSSGIKDNTKVELYVKTSTPSIIGEFAPYLKHMCKLSDIKLVIK
jgi:valyl-tRNA synthetase